MLRKGTIYLVLGIILAGGWLLSVGTTRPGKVGGVAVLEPYRIGVLVSLTGPGAFIGESYRTGMEIAKKEINAKGGIAGKPLELFYEDNQNTSQGGLSSFEAAKITKPKLIFTTMSAASVPISPLARDAGYPLVASAVFADILKDNPNAVSFFAQPEDGAKVTALDMQRNKVKEVGVVYLNSEYGKASLSSFEQASKDTGIKIVVAEPFNSDLQDYSQAVTKVLAYQPEAVYVIAVAATPVVESLKHLSSLPIYTNLIPVFGGLPGQSPKTYEGVHVVASAVAIAGTSEYGAWQLKLGDTKDKVGLGYSAVGYDGLNAITETLQRNSDSNQFVDTFSHLGVLKGVNGDLNFSGRRVGLPLYAAVVKDGVVVQVEK